MMSDEASGPEDEANETKADWKKRMATYLGMGELEEMAYKTLQVFEVIRPKWRSDEVRGFSRRHRTCNANRAMGFLVQHSPKRAVRDLRQHTHDKTGAVYDVPRALQWPWVR